MFSRQTQHATCAGKSLKNIFFTSSVKYPDPDILSKLKTLKLLLYYISPLLFFYLQAVIHEIQRVANISPLSVFHTTTTDTEIMGYTVPKVRLFINS